MRENFSVVFKKPREQVFRVLTDLEALIEAGRAAGPSLRVERVPDRPRTGLGSAGGTTATVPGTGCSACSTSICRGAGNR